MSISEFVDRLVAITGVERYTKHKEQVIGLATELLNSATKDGKTVSKKQKKEIKICQETNTESTHVHSRRILSEKDIICNASDITTFFSTSTRSKNDVTNKVRENVLKIICNPPKEYLENVEFGNYWRIVYKEWNIALKKIAEQTNVPIYTSTQIKVIGGRNSNYDADVMYYNEEILVASIKIEFKNGGSNIEEAPQFLSLQAKVGLFPKTYDKFWYENYLDKYIACDSGITEEKPSLQLYLKNVTSIKYSITPFFEQLKIRELLFKKEKNEVVNTSITDYLTKYGKELDIKLFSEKVKATQTGKNYLCWHDGKFCFDKFSDAEMSDMTYHSIKNGNVIEVKSGNTIYELLLRWRNHKGILNPAWQIKLKR